MGESLAATQNAIWKPNRSLGERDQVRAFGLPFQDVSPAALPSRRLADVRGAGSPPCFEFTAVDERCRRPVADDAHLQL